MRGVRCGLEAGEAAWLRNASLVPQPISKNALKKLEKQKKAAEEKAAKAAAAAAKVECWPCGLMPAISERARLRNGCPARGKGRDGDLVSCPWTPSYRTMACTMHGLLNSLFLPALCAWQAAEGGPGKAKKAGEEEELDPTKYFENRCDWVKAQKEGGGTNPYPHKFEVRKCVRKLRMFTRSRALVFSSRRRPQRPRTLASGPPLTRPSYTQVSISLPEFRKKFEGLPEGAHDETGGLISVAGRVWSKRASGAALIFYDLRGDGAKIQVCPSARSPKYLLPPPPRPAPPLPLSPPPSLPLLPTPLYPR
jgi:hypothetical protein